MYVGQSGQTFEKFVKIYGNYDKISAKLKSINR